VATAYGEQRTVQLPDGSLVKLNSHSRLRYAPAVAKNRVREVWLDGEGFFSVKHMPDNQRFVVHTTAGFSVEVLGTQFTVLRRQARAQVVLLTGKVRVDFDDKTRSQEVLLKPGELLETSDTQPERIVHKAVKVAPYSAWKDGKLVFDETPMAEVATRLSDTYGIRVVVQDPDLAQRRISGTFPVSDLDATLLVLEKSFHLTVRRTPQQITLSPQQ
jgi:transmembrane sensor